MDHKTIRDQFFDNQMHKFKKQAEYMNEETLYKFLWSFVKAGRLVGEKDAIEWNHVRHVIQQRQKEFSSKTMTNIMVLST